MNGQFSYVLISLKLLDKIMNVTTLMGKYLMRCNYAAGLYVNKHIRNYC
jgi:hypothetical protein